MLLEKRVKSGEEDMCKYYSSIPQTVPYLTRPGMRITA